MSVENYLPGDLCSGLIICWRKSSGEMSPGEKFLGEKCDEFVPTTSFFCKDNKTSSCKLCVITNWASKPVKGKTNWCI